MLDGLAKARAKRHLDELYCALRDLLDDTQHAEHHCGDEDCPVKRARRVLQMIDGTAPEPRPMSPQMQREFDELIRKLEE